MKTLNRTLFTVFAFIVLFFLSSDTVSAQSCSGQITCCLDSSTVCRNTVTGNPCTAGTANCSCSTSCTSWDIPQNCFLSGGNSCQVSNGCGMAQGGCNFTPAPPPAQPPPPGGGGSWGACGNCNCGHGNECRTDPGGSCVWDPTGCGGGGNPPPPPPTGSCTITTTGPFTVRVGARIAALITVSKSGGAVLGNMTFTKVGTGPGNFTIPSGWAGPTTTYETRIDGTVEGTGRKLRVAVDIINGLDCSRDIPVDVLGDLSLDLKANGSDGPITIPSGTAATLSWVSNGGSATVCTASGGWSGTKALTGSQSTGNLTANTTFSMQCVSGGGTRNDSVTVNVSAAPPPPPAAPTVNLTANGSNGPLTITSGASVTLAWTSTNATSCTASGAWGGNPPVNGNQSSGSITSSRTYTLTCTGPGGSASDNVTINVGAAPPPPPGAPTVNLTANGSGGPVTITSGAAVTLAWSTTNATSCNATVNVATSGWSGGKATSGSQSSGALGSSRTFTLTCTGAGGSASDNVTVNVGAPPPPPPSTPTVDLRVNGTNGPVTITSGGGVTLSWTSTNATSCTASGSWGGNPPVNGNQAVNNITSSRTYALTCTGPGGSASDNVSVTVSAPPPPPAPTVDLRANNSNGPVSITSGASVTLSWTSTNATGCTASNAWSGSRAVPSGSQSSGAITSNRTYTITCTGAGGSTADSVQVNVAGVPPPPPLAPTVDLRANNSNGPISVTSGSSVTLSWTSSNATGCTASGSWGGNPPVNGTQTVSNITSNRTYTLSCTGPGGSAADSVTVNISAAPPPPPGAPVVNLTANGSAGPVNITSGAAVTLAWTTTNATTCSATASVATSTWNGSKGTSGSQSSGAVASSRVFTLTCTGTGGTGSDNVAVNVSVAPPPPGAPTVNLTVNGSNGPLTITSGSSVTLSWATTNVTSCVASGSWGGNPPINGSQTVGPINSSRTYSLTCSGPGGSANDSVVVNVSAPPPVSCGTPAPYDPPAAQCASGPLVGDGQINWEWPALAGITQYEVDIARFNPATSTWTKIVDRPFLDGNSTYGCGSGLCSFVTSNLTPGTYRSEIRAQNPGVCSPASPWAYSPSEEVEVCNSCTISFPGGPINMVVGETIQRAVQVGPPPPSAPLGEVRYSTSTAGFATVLTPITTNPFLASIRGDSVGSTNLVAQGYMDGGPVCSTSIPVTLIEPDPWWQVAAGGVTTRGNISSEIPANCTADPTCEDTLIVDDSVSNKPGIAVYGGTSADFASGAPRGNVSSRDWLGNTRTLTSIYSYNYFYNLASGRPFEDLGNNVNINSGDVNRAVQAGENYLWLRAGNTTIAQPLNVNSKKVVLFVDGNLTINNRVSLNDLTTDFFMVVVRGNIIINPSVTSTDSSDPVLQGIFHADGNFSTGTTGAVDEMLVIEGSVSASTVTMERDLDIANVDTPAELFIYSPELAINYPAALSDKHLIWREVAP